MRDFQRLCTKLTQVFPVSSVTVVSIIRLRSIQLYTFKTTNPTWDFCDIYVWSEVEIGLSIVIACLPTLKLLTAKVERSTKKSNSDNSGASGSTKDDDFSNKSTSGLSKNLPSARLASIPRYGAGESDLDLIEDEENMIELRKHGVMVTHVATTSSSWSDAANRRKESR